ncbi:hypothetical protein [Roseimicrobium sp. ORNL1]|uniref:hypothetical protein n=1 Tax=Roseimicrobium sp. ORNL1 TaxID=2711231 RepID=UPI0013E123A2|nr:hypothetical protein [Roseimicrobium sp. ORNL1]QIF03522.1 hypothetical protein G5S37_18995 [Roseimicrobium sp. ORNL1]
MLTVDDLKYLELITDKSRLVGTNYFEFYPSDCLELPTCWNEGSLYISDMSFSAIAPAFERAVPTFGYNDFNRFSADELRNVERELSAFIATLESATSHDQILPGYQIERWSGVPIESLVPALVHAVSGISAFCRKSREQPGVLWVLGM